MMGKITKAEVVLFIIFAAIWVVGILYMHRGSGPEVTVESVEFMPYSPGI